MAMLKIQASEACSDGPTPSTLARGNLKTLKA